MSDSIKILHNPKCSKSRATLQLLTEKGMQTNVVEYLKTPPTAKELEEILQMLNIQPRELMRSHEAEYKNNNLADESLTREQLIAAMVSFPKLIERPIVIHKGKAAIGRPIEKVIEILK